MATEQNLTPANYWADFKPEFTEETKILVASDERGKTVKLVMRNSGGFWIVKKGKGRDAEDALRIAGKNKDMYMSAMMSRTVTTEDGACVLMEDMADYDLDEYLRLQTAFAEINF